MPQTYTKTTRRVERRVVWTRNGRDYVRRRAKDGTMRFTAVSLPRKQRGGRQSMWWHIPPIVPVPEVNTDAILWKVRFKTLLTNVKNSFVDLAVRENIDLGLGIYEGILAHEVSVYECIDNYFRATDIDNRRTAMTGILGNMRLVARPFESDDNKYKMFVDFYDEFDKWAGEQPGAMEE